MSKTIYAWINQYDHVLYAPSVELLARKARELGIKGKKSKIYVDKPHPKTGELVACCIGVVIGDVWFRKFSPVEKFK